MFWVIIENEVKDIYISEWTRLLKEDGTALHGIESGDIDYSNLSEEVKKNIIIDGHVGLEAPSKIKERFMQFYKEVTLENCMGLCYNWYDIQKYQTTEQSIGKELRDYLLTFNPDQIRAFNSAMLLIRNRLAENNQLNDSGGFVFVKARNRISR